MRASTGDRGRGPAPVHLVDATMFWNPSGGVHRYLCAKRRWLQQHTDWRHTVAAPLPDGTATLQLASAPLPGSGGDYRLPWQRRRLATTLRGAEPSLIEAHDPYRTAWAALDAAAALAVPSVAFCHSNLAQLARMATGSLESGNAGQARLGPARWLGRLADAAARRYALHLYGRFDLVLAPSRSMQRHLADWGIAGAVHQPLGVDTATFHPRQRDPGLRARLGLPADARLLVFAGRFAPEKRLPTLAAAVRLLGPRHWLVAMGSGPAPPTGERVVVLPATPSAHAVARLLASCDACVHAGQQETFGLSVLEAMACGLPVVAQAAEGLAELVDDGVGRRVRGPRPADFAQALDSLFNDDARRHALGQAARCAAEAHDWGRVFPVLHQRYVHLLAERG